MILKFVAINMLMLGIMLMGLGVWLASVESLRPFVRYSLAGMLVAVGMNAFFGAIAVAESSND